MNLLPGRRDSLSPDSQGPTGISCISFRAANDGSSRMAVCDNTRRGGRGSLLIPRQKGESTKSVEQVDALLRALGKRSRLGGKKKGEGQP